MIWLCLEHPTTPKHGMPSYTPTYSVTVSQHTSFDIQKCNVNMPVEDTQKQSKYYTLASVQ